MIEDKREGNKAATPVTIVKKTSTMGPNPSGPAPFVFQGDHPCVISATSSAARR
jgi:hypothetical protein